MTTRVRSGSAGAVSWPGMTVAPLAVGLGIGVLTNLAQGWLPGGWNQVANSGAVWSLAAFVVGALLVARSSVTAAVVGGLAVECGLVIGYYGFAEVGRGGMGDPFWPLVWLVLAFVAGPLFGWAGASWRRGRRVPARVVGLAALAGVFGMEAVHYAWNLGYAASAWAFGAVAVLVPLLGRAHRERAWTLAAACALALTAFAVVLPVLDGLSA